jgi:membrane-associated protein
LYVNATDRQPSRCAAAASSSGDAADVSVSISRDLEMSQFWQNRQARLQPAVPKDSTDEPGRKWLSGFFSTGSTQKPLDRPYEASTTWSSMRPRTKHRPRCPSRSLQARGHTSHWIRPSASRCQYEVGTVYGSARLSWSAAASATPHTVLWLAVETAEQTSALAEHLSFNPIDPGDWLRLFGPFALIGVWAILFAETGLLAGFFFPGDSLLFLAGVAASPVAEHILGEGVQIPIIPLLIGAPICAIAGAQLGHFLGARYGRRMFDRPNSRIFKQEYVAKAEHYFNKFGPAKAVVLARFIPIVRTFLNPVAGVLGMPARTFLLWNVVGGILWTDGIILAGYLLADQITNVMEPEDIDKYILPVVFVIVLLSLIPVFVEMYRVRRDKRREKALR